MIHYTLRMTPALPTRRKHHTRSIQVDAFERSDGLWDFEARISDIKHRDFQLATGPRKAGEPVHDMLLTFTVDLKLNIVAAQAQSLATPYPGYCDTIGPAYQKLVGLNLLDNFRGNVKQRLGAVQGCTHITELCSVLPTAVIQAYAGVVLDTKDGDGGAQTQRPFQLDRCHALKSDGPAVQRFYPKWYGNKS
ncbi:MAG: hypothetical protein RL341_1143 [Pseudomonadota bacterium]|jgi:hypothetical protein